MKFYLATLVYTSLAAAASLPRSAQDLGDDKPIIPGCTEREEFGSFVVTPSTVSPGGSVFVNANYTCAIGADLGPKNVTYFLDGRDNDRHDLPRVQLKFIDYTSGLDGPLDATVLKIPQDGQYLTDGSYRVTMVALHEEPDGAVAIGEVPFSISITL